MVYSFCFEDIVPFSRHRLQIVEQTFIMEEMKKQTTALDAMVMQRTKSEKSDLVGIIGCKSYLSR